MNDADRMASIDDRQSFAVSVLSRLNEAIIPRRRRVGIGDDWTPKPHYCHDNVAIWVKANPQHKHVFGFVVFDFRVLGYMQIVAHSL